MSDDKQQATLRTQDTLRPEAPPAEGPAPNTKLASVRKPDRKVKVLLVDDSRFSLGQVRKALTDEYDIDEVMGGAEALAKMEQQTYDVVITDLLMPHISGLAFLGHARARHPDTRMIVSSADIQETTAQKARSLGAVAFVPKPVNPEELRQVMRVVLARKSIPNSLPFSPRYADAFKEIFNIGMGRAANALSKLVYEKIKLSVPRLEVLPRAALEETVRENFSDDLALVRQDFSGGAKGIAFLLMSKESGMRLVSALVSDGDRSGPEVSEADRELLVEVGNILINALVGSMGNTLGLSFDLERAKCEVGRMAEVVGQFDNHVADYVLLVETLFLMPGRHIGGNLFLMMTSEEMGNLLSGIDRVL
jgi:chemotaxis protein CheC